MNFMKKYKSCYAVLTLILLLFNTQIYANYTSENTFTDIYNKLWLTDASTKEKMEKSFDDHLNKMWETQYILAPNYSREQIGLSGSIDEQYQQYMDSQQLDYEKAFKVYSLVNNRYTKQYIDNGNFEYLIDSDYYWCVPYKREDTHCAKFDKNGIYRSEYTGLILDSSEIIDANGLNFLLNFEGVKELVSENIKETITGIKLLVLDEKCTCMYIDCNSNKYLINLYKNQRQNVEFVPQFQLFKIYDIESAIAFVCSDVPWMDCKKTEYVTEAQQLQEDGLLQGNENGLDLLKPLTRAEAVTLLIRAIGLEEQTVNYPVSQFSDIASDDWASPYAALAKAEGITNGISETEFAPDDRVTADQFATFTLRAAGENNFDYTQGIQILIDRGVITEEESETMDLFTRGDMAKIIYEAREAGLL